MKAFPRDVEVLKMKERHIGIESELRVNSVDSLCECGCGEFTGSGQELTPELQKELDKHGMLASVGHDGGGREFRTNPISVRSLYQVRGKRYLTEYYKHLKGSTEVVDSGGTHIHISILENDHENMEANATALAVAFYNQFQKISGRKTDWARRFDIKNTDLYRRTPDLTTVEGIREYINQQNYKDMEIRQGYESHRLPRTYCMKGSMLNPTRHRTLEFRGPKGSNDIEEILAWADFLENVIKAANKESIEGVKFGDLVKTERIAEYISGLKGWRKFTKTEMNKTVNVNALVA